MSEINDKPATVPAQPEASGPIKRRTPVVIILVGVVVLIGLTNLAGLLTGTKKEAPRSTLPGRPLAANPAQVNSFETQQGVQARQDQEERNRQQTVAAQMAALQSEGAVPGPESTAAAPMSPAQRQAIYGSSPNAPQKTSNASQANAEAKQRALAHEKLHQDALNSDTVAIDFAHPTARGATKETAKNETVVEGEQSSAQDIEQGTEVASTIDEQKPTTSMNIRAVFTASSRARC